MKRKAFLGLLSVLFGFYSHAQVKDISVTVAPTAEYTWWSNKTILKDSPFIGGRVGFGFGRYFEIRGVYMKTVDLKGTLEDINVKYLDKLTNELAKDLKDTKVDVTRWGGEMKANIGLNGWFEPYLTLGTGVQTFKFKREAQKLDEYKEEQIYASLGLGAKFNLSDRIVLALEGRNTAFNLNEGNVYLSPDFERDGKDNRMYNWSALASLEFYLGGRNPNEMTELDRAYRDTFRGGLKGFKLVVEPGMMYINFDDETPFADSYFLGGGAGFDFSEYIGIRGFYYEATKEGDLKLNFNNKLKLYGGNIIARLNHNTGVTPYLSLGGGYMDVADDFINKDGKKSEAGGNGFAMGGVGLEIPLSKYVLAYGSANYLMTATKDLKPENVSDPSKLRDNIAFRAGLRFQLGAKADNPHRILKSYDAKYKDEMVEMREIYEKRIDKLNKELEKAYEEDNVEKAVTILEERKRNEKQLDNAVGKRSEKKENVVKMSREEFEKLVNEVIKKIDNEKIPTGYENQRINQLEESLLQMNTNAPQNANVAPASTKILEELKRLNEQVKQNTDLINKSLGNKEKVVAPIIVNPNTGETKVVDGTNDVQNGWEREGFSILTGPSFGKGFSWNLGFRSYQKMGTSENFKFMPEIYLGLGSKTAFGFSANVIYQFTAKKGKLMNPYAGLGLGLFRQNETSLGTNIIIGTELDVLDGKLFVDYSSRNMFKNNQIAVGYRFIF